MSDERLHPRPLLARAAWLDLDGPWEVRFGPQSNGSAWDEDAPARTILVPFPPESELSGIGEDGHTEIWYRRRWAYPERSPDERVLLHFGGVDHTADVWVDGVHVGRHEGGQAAFAFDVTDALRGDEHVIVVRAIDSVSLEQPRGKQDWEPEPHVIWYRRTSGIWRSVWAEVVHRIHLEQLDWRPTASGEVGFQARLSEPADAELELEFGLPEGAAVVTRWSVTGGRAAGTVRLFDPRVAAEPERLLWSPERPTLLDATARVRVSGGVVDEVASYVGLRTAGADDEAFLLNGRPYFLRLVLEQAFWPQSHLAAPSDDALRREVELIKELGFNGLRLHQVSPDPRFLAWCDRLGLLVLADAAAAYEFSDLALTRTTTEWMELVQAHRSHPSIVAWVAFNESWGVPELERERAQQDAVRALTNLLKALDPTRPVIGNDGWEYVAGDLLGIHDYTQSAETLRSRYRSYEATRSTVAKGRPGGRRLFVGDAAPAVPVVLSEFGGVTLSAGPTWEGYGSVDDPAALLERLSALFGSLGPDGLAGFCYTQLTDTLQEANGLLTADRAPKADPTAIRRVVSGT